MKRLIVALALVASLGMAGHALAMDKKINIFNGAQYDIYTLYLSCLLYTSPSPRD